MSHRRSTSTGISAGRCEKSRGRAIDRDRAPLQRAARDRGHWGSRPWLCLASLCLLAAVTFSAAAAEQPGVVTLEFYTRPGCGHCAEAHRYLQAERAARPSLVIREYDVTRDPDALDRLETHARRAGITAPAVPTFVIGGRVLVGFDPSLTPPQLRTMIEGAGASDARAASCAAGASRCPEASSPELRLPLVGRVSVERFGLPGFTFIVGLVDGINPCATWVLLFLLAMLVNLKSRPRMALIAGTFVVVSGLVYFAFMAAWLTFFAVIGVSTPVRLVLAALALTMGSLNLKDFFVFGRGPSLSIPEAAKPGFYARVRSVLEADNLGAALVGVITIAFLVNLVELMCTAGLPALYTAILSGRELATWEHYGYLALYIVAYMLDDTVLVTIGVITLSKRKLQVRAGRWLKLVSGLTIFVLGILLLARPTWLGF